MLFISTIHQMKSRGYIILFSENIDSDLDNKLKALEYIRRELESIEITSEVHMEFDIIQVCHHSPDNCYPEIGIHVVKGYLQKEEWEHLENVVIKKSKDFSMVKTSNFDLPDEFPLWKDFIVSGVYPNRL